MLQRNILRNIKSLSKQICIQCSFKKYSNGTEIQRRFSFQSVGAATQSFSLVHGIFNKCSLDDLKDLPCTQTLKSSDV